MLENINLVLNKNNQEILDITKALSSIQRLEILELINTSSMSVKEISDKLGYPLSSTLLNVNILAECNLITIQEKITKTGKSKLCSRNVDYIGINIFSGLKTKTNEVTFEVPIGNYTSYDIEEGTGCGIATKHHTIGTDNDSNVFFNEERFKAQYIWFNYGFLEYKISTKKVPENIDSITISFECCSEAPFYRNDWKSDISLYINNKEVGTWTSLGDYGGRRGKNNPNWWPDTLTQFGVLTNWTINKIGTYVNSQKISDVTIKDLKIKPSSNLSIRIGVKKDATNCGGLSLFGSCFGDYNQHIKVTFNCN